MSLPMADKLEELISERKARIFETLEYIAIQADMKVRTFQKTFNAVVVAGCISAAGMALYPRVPYGKHIAASIIVALSMATKIGLKNADIVLRELTNEQRDRLLCYVGGFFKGIELADPAENVLTLCDADGEVPGIVRCLAASIGLALALGTKLGLKNAEEVLRDELTEEQQDRLMRYVGGFFDGVSLTDAPENMLALSYFRDAVRGILRGITAFFEQEMGYAVVYNEVLR